VARVAAPDPQHAALAAGVGLFLGERDGRVGVFGEELRLAGPTTRPVNTECGTP
jgi:hypothetical protein